MVGASVQVEHKDLVLAVFASAVGMAGLLLIFQGFILTAYISLPAVTPQDVKRGHRRAVYGAFAAIVVAIASITDCLVWLLSGWGFNLVIALFGATLLSVLLLGGFVSIYLVR